MPDPVLAATRAAAEAVRRANHAAYDAPKDPVSVYERVGAAHELLAGLVQLVGDLADAADRLVGVPGLASTAGDGRLVARAVTNSLQAAQTRVEMARGRVNQAWADSSTLYIEEEKA